ARDAVAERASRQCSPLLASGLEFFWVWSLAIAFAR
ncbi:hypothetical protein A2U01_0109808, partial [Trifolium medium]|nr:hypothetical protein [Trifolium medium]